ncbi:MAG: phage integrase N-terminal SAM-like domain-containing protein [Planctomycetota bacterium]|jgi:hypothetical protein
MTPYQKRVTAFTKRMAEDMQLRNLSPRAIDAYTYHVDRFAARYGKHPEELGPQSKPLRVKPLRVKPCPPCQGAMPCIVKESRPKWRELFYGPGHPAWYEWTSRGLCSVPDDTGEAASHVEDAPDPDWDPGPDLFDEILASRLE